MKMLSRQRPFPPIEISVPTRFSQSAQEKGVTCDPRTVFKISGGPERWMASFNASTQRSASTVVERHQASTLRVEAVHEGDETWKSPAAS